MVSSSGKADFVIQEVAGCGPFQTIISFFVYFIGKIAVVFSMYFLIFSIYNPGWRCLDDAIENHSLVPNTSLAAAPTAPEVMVTTEHNRHLLYGKNFHNHSSAHVKDYNNDNGGQLIFDNCTLFYSCQNVQFDKGTSTLVSEWGLICDRAWIGSLIISMHMMGILVGSFFIGQLGDSIGRKPTIYGAQLMVAALNFVSVYSTSWQMMAVLRFFVGMACCANMNLAYVYVAEYVTSKWRARIAAIPFWPVIAIIYGLVQMALKDWRYILIVTSVATVIGFLPVFWIPESLRWLEVKQKNEKFLSVAKKVSRVNGKILPLMDCAESLQDQKSDSSTAQKKQKSYMLLHLFKRGYILPSLITGLEWFSASVSYNIINLGIQSLYGSFYLNFILVALVSIPPNFIAMAMANSFGRKVCKLLWLGLVIASFVAATGFLLSPWVSLQTTGVFVVVLIAKSAISGYWCFLPTHTAELYPTVVRSLAINWSSLFARVGGAIAPFLVTSVHGTSYVLYAAMAALGLLSGLTLLYLRETKGQPLKETFEDDIDYASGKAQKDGYNLI